MQNQTPTANLQALVPKIAARGQCILQIFSHSSKPQSMETKLKQEVHKKHLVHLERRPQNIGKPSQN